jgi:hypothetical protein
LDAARFLAQPAVGLSAFLSSFEKMTDRRERDRQQLTG